MEIFLDPGSATSQSHMNLSPLNLQGWLSIRLSKVQISLPLPTLCAQEVSMVRNFYYTFSLKKEPKRVTNNHLVLFFCEALNIHNSLPIFSLPFSTRM